MGGRIQPVYLWRKGNPSVWAAGFFESWLNHDPGEQVRLIVLLKGFDGRSPLLPHALSHRIDPVHVGDDGYDLTAYLTFASDHPEGTFLFLNSHSRFETSRWYEHLQATWEACGKKGLLGATGSWETTQHGHVFPNSHIRTTGFVVRGRDYVEAAGKLDTREDCLQFEAGRDGLTQYFLVRDLPVKVVNAEGRMYGWRDWPQSKTFRLGDQEGLLFSDNRTRHYHYGSNRKRKRLSQQSWGSDEHVARLSLVSRLRRWVWIRLLYFGQRPNFLARARAFLS